MTKLRPYQQEAIDAIFDYWAQGGENPLVEAATGVGKSVIIAELCRELLTRFPTMRILCLVHVQELVAQNAEELIKLWPAAPVGINSAGLGRRDKHSTILFASIQSVWRLADRMGDFDLVLIDECHLIPVSGDGMYRTLLDGLRRRVPDLRVVGMTATPYRLGTGRLDSGEDRLFTKTVYTYGIAEGVRDGYLAPLVAKGTKTGFDLSDVARRGGEFSETALQAAVNTDELVKAAVDEIVAFGEDRQSWLVFCAGVEHAKNVAEEVKRRGFPSETVHGGTDKDQRKRIIADFKAGRIRCLTNDAVLVAGFNAPKTDLIAMLRGTLSVSRYVQMLGRGTRTVYPHGFDANTATAEERREAIARSQKANCLVLDFAQNVRRHGPVDQIKVREKKAGTSVDMVMVKTCPECETLNALGARTCESCGFEFPFAAREANHDVVADGDAQVMSSGLNPLLPRWVPVSPMHTQFKKHTKPNSPPSMRVEYIGTGWQNFRLWVCFEHTGFARAKAEKWWIKMGGEMPVPATVDEALARTDEIAPVSEIMVKTSGKYEEIVGYRFREEEEEAAA